MALKDAIEHMAKTAVAYDHRHGEFPGPAFRMSMEGLLWGLNVRKEHAGHMLEVEKGMWKGCENDVLSVTCLNCALTFERPREHDL